jgi:methionyl-tRNA formyltransferase
VPSRGFINVHFSLLPRWRGAAPVERSMMAGDMRTGVTIMALDEGLDTGPTLASRSTVVGVGETGGTLTSRLALSGAELLGSTLPLHLSRTAYPLPQPSEGATVAPKLTKDDRRYVPDVGAATLRRSIMALAPVPGLTAVHDGQGLKLLRAGAVRPERPTHPAGTLVEVDGRLWCWATNGRVELLEVQPAGKRAMNAWDWIQGRAGRLGHLT